MNPAGNETDILHLGGGRWLAASREFKESRDVHLELFVSTDDARTWERRMPLSLPMQVTGNLAALADGRILLSYGNRCWNNFGVDVRISEDQGKTWSPPIRIADCPRADCGYPSTSSFRTAGPSPPTTRRFLKTSTTRCAWPRGAPGTTRRRAGRVRRKTREPAS